MKLKSQVEKLQKLIPRQQFAFKIQAKALGRIISSESVSAFVKMFLCMEVRLLEEGM
jgi:translation elongation factor EF-4